MSTITIQDLCALAGQQADEIAALKMLCAALVENNNDLVDALNAATKRIEALEGIPQIVNASGNPDLAPQAIELIDSLSATVEDQGSRLASLEAFRKTVVADQTHVPNGKPFAVEDAVSTWEQEQFGRV